MRARCAPAESRDAIAFDTPAMQRVVAIRRRTERRRRLELMAERIAGQRGRKGRSHELRADDHRRAGAVDVLRLHRVGDVFRRSGGERRTGGAKLLRHVDIAVELQAIVGECIERRRSDLRARRDLIGEAGAERELGGRLADRDGVEPSRAVGRNLDVQIIVAGEPDLGAAGEIGLQQQRERFRGALLAHLVAQVAVAAFRDGFGGPERVVELGAERVGRIRRGADAEQRQVL